MHVLLLCACSPQNANMNMANPSYWTDTDIAGPDVDSNGIRDDVDAWIAKQPFNEPQKKAAQQFARSSQHMLVTKYTDREDARRDSIIDDRSIDCLGDVFINKRNPQDTALFSSTVDELMRAILNTRARILKDDLDSSMLSGMVFKPSFGVNACE